MSKDYSQNLYIQNLIKAECEQMYLALKRDLQTMIRTEVNQALKTREANITETIKENLAETLTEQINTSIDTKLRSTEDRNNRQLALVAQTQTQQLAKVMINVEKAAVNKTIKYINEKIMPVVEGQMEFIAQQTLDGTELATEYRRAVYSDNVPKLTSGDAKADNQAKFFFFTEHDS